MENEFTTRQFDKDDDPGNNSLSNLRWGTRKENCEDRAKNGGDLLGEKCPQSILKEKDVIKIRRLRKEGRSLKNLVSLFNVSDSLISSICLRKSWKHVK